MEFGISFYGAAKNVTGSRYLLHANGLRILVDCGLYQERELKHRNWDAFHVPPSSIDAVLLTHAHLDHCGLLPKLVREGFAGKIYTTAASADIARIVLLDSAKIQEEDVAFKIKRHEREGRQGPYPLVPLYTNADVENCLPHFATVPYEQAVPLGPGVEAVFHDAGHILGSSMVRLKVSANGQERSVLFSGDVGRWDVPILRDPSIFEQADYVVTESTYGDREHGPADDVPIELADIINRTCETGGNILIPSFAVERAQELLYYLSMLLAQDRIPHLNVFVDSPMAVKVTNVFRRHPDLFDAETIERINHGRHPCDFPGLVMCRTVDESKAINRIKGTVIVIAGSGMCTGGRIKHHLVHNIERPESTVLFVGYQAHGTLGRIILDGADRVRILGRWFEPQARIERVHGFSAHADRNELWRWLSALKSAPRRVFVTHGEPEAAEAFSEWLNRKTGWNTMVPDYEQSVPLD